MKYLGFGEWAKTIMIYNIALKSLNDSKEFPTTYV